MKPNGRKAVHLAINTPSLIFFFGEFFWPYRTSERQPVLFHLNRSKKSTLSASQGATLCERLVCYFLQQGHQALEKRRCGSRLDIVGRGKERLVAGKHAQI